MSKRALGWIAALALALAVHVAALQLERWVPGLHRSAQLAALLLLTKLLADLLERPFRPRRATFYYEDYFGEWVHYGALAAVALAGHFALSILVDGPMPTGWVALGVYLTWRATSPRR